MVAYIPEEAGPAPPQATTAKTNAGMTINLQEMRSMAWIIACAGGAEKVSTIKRTLASKFSVVYRQEFHCLAQAHAHNRNFKRSNNQTWRASDANLHFSFSTP